MNFDLQFEEAARDAADELTQPRPLGEENVEDIQVLLKSEANPVQIRELRVSCYGDQYYCTCTIYPIIHTVRTHGPTGEGARDCDPGVRGEGKGHQDHHPVSQLS